MISDEHQSGVNPLILRRFLDFFNGEKPPPGAAPKRGVGSSNLFWDAKTGWLVRRSEGAFHKPPAFYPAQDDAGGATAFGHQSIAHGCAPYAMK